MKNIRTYEREVITCDICGKDIMILNDSMLESLAIDELKCHICGKDVCINCAIGVTTSYPAKSGSRLFHMCFNHLTKEAQDYITSVKVANTL
jgi:hypothetical protein